MNNYASNSTKSRENVEDERKEVKKITKGKPVVRKKSELSKIAKSMISDECMNIKDYAIYEVIIPAVTDTIIQVVEGAINMVFKGDARPSSRRRSSVNASRVSYSNFYDERRGGSSRRSSRYDEPRRSTRLSYDDVSFETREDANEVLNAMDDIVEEYGVVRVADLFELGGFTGNGSTDHDYGWTTTKTASVERDRDGKFYIKIGRPSPIK